MSFGATLLGAFMGRKVVKASTLGRATTAARSLSRTQKESQDVARAGETVEVLQQRLQDLDAEFKAEVAALEQRLDAQNEALERLALRPKKTGITVQMLALAWTPAWRAADASAVPAPAQPPVSIPAGALGCGGGGPQLSETWTYDPMTSKWDFLITNNNPPLVNLTSPTNNSVFAGPTNVLIEATASDTELGTHEPGRRSAIVSACSRDPRAETTKGERAVMFAIGMRPPEGAREAMPLGRLPMPFDTVYRVRFNRVPGGPLAERPFTFVIASALGKIELGYGNAAVGPDRPEGSLIP